VVFPSLTVCRVDISSEDDAKSVKSTRSTKRYIVYLLMNKMLLVLMTCKLPVRCRWMMIQNGSPHLHGEGEMPAVTVICILTGSWSPISQPQEPKTPMTSRTSSVYVKLVLFMFALLKMLMCIHIVTESVPRLLWFLLTQMKKDSSECLDIFFATI
jgi:hypothetical protein